MLQKKLSKRPKEMVQITVPKSRLRRPFPLLWGLMALGLFMAFATITLIQLDNLNSDEIYQARMDTYNSDQQAYDTAIKAHLDCVNAVKAREVYRGMFEGISSMFEKSANLPVELFPMSAEAKVYQQTLLQSIQEFITEPLDDELKPRDLGECPKVPDSRPTKPER